ncbi:MAG TPA: MFS transporter [Planctomycetota bacterium]|nr:MFS transporter [Planctomycetota bacterium]
MATPASADPPLPTSPFAPFRHGDFTLYQLARVFLIVGGQMFIVALQWQVYALTDSRFHLGMIGLAQFLPNVLLSLVGGHVADRLNRRKIVMACAWASAATGALLAWESTHPRPSLAVIYIACGLLGTIRAFSAPAGTAFLPALVPGAILPGAITWHLTVFQLATIVGPAIGGFIYGGTHASRTYAAGAAFYGAAFLGMALLRVRPGPRSGQEPFERAVKAGIRHVWTDRRLLGAMSLDLFAVLLGGATALLPAIARDILHRGPEVLGMLRSAPSVGAGLMAVLLAFHPLRRRIGAWILGGVLVFGVATIGFGCSTSLWLTAALLILSGGADMVSVTVRHTLIQVATPDAMRGRVSSVSMVFINTSNELGEFESGVTAHWWGTTPAIVVGGIGTCVVVALWTALFPDLRRADRFEPASTGTPGTPPDPSIPAAPPAAEGASSPAPDGTSSG